MKKLTPAQTRNAAAVSRREFIKRTAVVAGAAMGSQFLGAPYVLAGADAKPALRVALIGVGGQGGYSFDEAIKERIVAMCDVDESHIAEKMKMFSEKRPELPAPRIFYDYRKMFDEYQSEFDVVLIATPDHHHASASLRAIHHGKATFCQKPLCHDIAECYAVAKAAREKNVLTQMGNQGHCGDAIRKACEYIWDGAIGNVTETHSLLGRDFGGRGGRPRSQPVPEGLHWEEWIGPAPYRDYHDGLHPFSWRNWRAFGTGTIGDMACHNLDALFWALKIGEAKTFTVECLHTEEGSDEKYPKRNIVRYEVPARGKLGPVKVHVYDQKELRPDIMKETEKTCGVTFDEDTLFVGDKGLFRTSGTAGSATLLPEDKQSEYPRPPKTIPRAHGGPIEDLFYAIKHGTTPCSNFPDAAAPLTIFALSGHLAQFAGVGKKLQWDVEKMQCVNMPEISQYVRRDYRKGWEV